MLQPTSCSHLRHTYNRLLEATEELKDALNKADTSGNFNRSHELRTEIIALKASLEPYRTTILETTIQVPMLDKNGNPKKNLLGRPKTTEQTIRIDFKKELKEQKEWYETHGLASYADALKKAKRVRLTKQQKDAYIREIQEKNQQPRFTFFPDREIQEASWKDLQKIVSPPEGDPAHDTEAEKIQRALYLNNPYIVDDFSKSLPIPENIGRDRPYLLLTFDNPAVLEETRNETRDPHTFSDGSTSSGASGIFDTHNKDVRTPKGFNPITFPTAQEMLVLERMAAGEALERERQKRKEQGEEDGETWLPTTDSERNALHAHQAWTMDRGATWVANYWVDEDRRKYPVLACWGPLDSRVRVYWRYSFSRYSSIGARPAVIAVNALVS